MALFSKRTFARLCLALLALLLALLAYGLHRLGPVAAGYAARVTALVHFSSGQPLGQIRRERLLLPLGLERFVKVHIDEQAHTVRAVAFGRYEREETWHPQANRRPAEDPSVGQPWPIGEEGPTSSPSDELTAALDAALAPGLGTHAVLVAQGGRLIAERYASGVTPSTPLMGWSMSKTVTGVMIGRARAMELLPDRKLPVPFPQWQGDARREITTEQLLNMNSGLEFFTNYSLPWSDSVQMLFVSRDTSAYAMARPLGYPPGTRWYYCDGTSNLLGQLLGDAVGENGAARTRWAEEQFFDRLRMYSARFAQDDSGHFVGSSFVLASARDWARLGQFLIEDGQVGGERLLPQGWVDFLATRCDESPHGSFGAHLWRYDPEAGLSESGEPYPDELAGLVYASGFGGQYLLLDRERNRLFLRLGVAPVEGRFPSETIANQVLRALP